MRLSLTTWIFIAVVLGGALGLFAPSWAPAFAIFGDIFKYGLMILIIPLVVTSMITGVGSIGDVRKLGRLGLTSLAYYVATTLIAVAIGLALVNLVQPGVQSLPQRQEQVIAAFHRAAPSNQPISKLEIQDLRAQLQLDPILDKALAERLLQALQRGLLVDNAALQKVTRAQLSALQLRQAIDGKSSQAQRQSSQDKVAKLSAKPKSWGDFGRDQVRSILQNPVQAMANGQVLAVIFFSLLLGGALTTLGEAGRRALDLFATLNAAVMKLVHLVMWTAPLGVFALIAEALAAGGVQTLKLLASYSAVVLTGLLLHGVVILPSVLAFLGRRTPWRYAAQVRPAIAVAFSTSSSAATLPVSIESAEQADVDKQVAGFVLPLGATINMDGTALYEAVAALFIAQVYGVSLSPGQQIVVFFTAVLAAIGAAAIPSAGTVTMAMVLSAVGLPIEGIGLILAVDRFLDMLRTTVNVWGDLVGAAVIARLAPLGIAKED